MAEQKTRRDFIYIAATGGTVVGIGLSAWPFLDSFNPAADTLAAGTTEVDVSALEPGERVTVAWRERPVFIERRTPQTLALARADDDDPNLIDPEIDADRVKDEEWLVVIGVCTHLGCVPLGQSAGDNRGRFGGWYCPCHGSVYDVSGRVRRGPAPTNLEIPPYQFTAPLRIRIGD
ncbi:MULTISPECIES: ubiquinol-cytochrome c reductase iron-sulfur subunit [Maricaulis]|jgi:ubiquinol-cytochrome c reductase iron-sulfur subunit|uniref:Ubiquinol-cytochrome c reductase iron-sulfur subunit n=1 Tax=Maricaulis maris (strain MCS10) TaxID=394221 RepID=Q0ATA6_MARMM|nr:MULTISPECIES: ubiquinol-cytochrome c reductase iron-sulfur subunit [Maricaulis]ABI64481.1 ubiquinol-cytochrome c reductase, iron-sulfur subunit [Maricaulis maris MCS10]MAC88667.1 ubiquinol-cytochrome c reductase iron-sulfur subunit [Maricaulis sp.]